jgi:hypothetical protein
MAFTFWLAWLKGCRGPAAPRRSRRGAIAPRRSFVPCLQALEDRTVPSTFTVTNLADSGTGSLRQAILDANANPGADLIKFAGGLHGTIPLASELSITDALTINGPGANQVTVSGGNASRVFYVSGTTVAIDDLTIANGRVSVPAGPAFGGGMLNDGANVTLSKDVFVNNEATSSAGYAGGGAVANLDGAHLTTTQTDFLNNTASGGSSSLGNGGAVYDDQLAVVDIEHATFSGNLATGGFADGGAIGHYGGSQLTLDHCTFDDNQVLALPPGPSGPNAAGGAIESDRTSSGFFELGGADLGQPTMTITHCSFTGNLAHALAATDGNDGTQPRAVPWTSMPGPRPP